MIIGEDQNVRIREFQESDIPKLAAYANNVNISNNLSDRFPNPFTIQDAKNLYSRAKAMNPTGYLAIEFNEQYAGNIGLTKELGMYSKRAEIGYFVAKPFWNKGIATKAVSLIVKYGFEKFDIVRIHTGIFSYNKASQRVLEKCGFIKEGVFQKAIFKNGILYDEVRYAILKD